MPPIPGRYRVYYNDSDPKSAAWLRELIKAGLIPPGDVDDAPIQEVPPTRLAKYRSCHFFAGIGGWPYALRLAGWPDDRPVWTGSCPCQPYSSAGKGQGDDDPRNLWPEMFRLVRECRPDVVFGEQVEGAVRHGWLDRVCADLEGEGYAVGAAVLGAHSVGAPHVRQRLYWVAHARHGAGRISGDVAGQAQADERTTPREGRDGRDGAAIYRGTTGLLADANGRESGDGRVQPGGEHGQQPADGGPRRRVGNPASGGRGELGNATLAGDGGHAEFPGWSRFDLIPCRDNKARRVEPGSFPLAHGVPGRVGLLRGYGNAIVPQVAAEFIKAYTQALEDRPPLLGER